MPYVDRIYRLCFDIYLCRETKAYALEEDLYAKLIFIMRSRETCVNYTRNIRSAYHPRLVEERTRSVE